MDADVDVGSRPTSRRRARWIALAVVVVAAVAAVGLRGLVTGSESTLERQLADRVVTILEEASLEEHADHGHHFQDEGGPILCGAEPFGYEPADATTVDEVRVVYTHHMCAVALASIPWPQSVRAGGPIVVELSDPPQVILPAEGTSYAEEVRKILPERYHEVALSTGAFRDEAVTEELKRRLKDAAS